jgi:hypothetical protein
VGIAPPTVAHICSNDANPDFFRRHDVFHSLRRNYSTEMSFVRVVRPYGPS